MNANVIFTKQTKDALANLSDLSVRERGRLRFTRLKELDASGVLSKAKNRADVARLVGYTEEQARKGYTWVSSLIARGHLVETIQEWTPNGRRLAEYHVSGTPDYSYSHGEHRRRKDKAKKGAGIAMKNITDDTLRSTTPVKVELSKDGLLVRVEGLDAQQAQELVVGIAKVVGD